MVNPLIKNVHSAAVIFFHGLGDSGRAVRQWMTPPIKKFDIPHINFVFPTAPSIHYIPYNETLNAWFNKYKPNFPEDQESLNSAETKLERLIAKEVSSGISVNRIVVGGFSMGGAIALHLGYRWESSVAGVFALSSYLQKDSAVFEALKHGGSPAPLFMRHGDSDALIPLEWGEKTYDRLAQLGVDVDFNVISGMEHDVEDEEIDELLEWISGILPP